MTLGVRCRRRTFRLPAGESALTRLGRVEGVLKELKDGRQPSKRSVARCLIEYQRLLKLVWLWQLEKAEKK